jgi:hypothetical protein
MFSIFLIVFFALAVGMALAVFASRQTTPNAPPLVPPEDDYAKDAKEERALTLDDLYRVAEKLCTENKLRIKDRLKNSETEVYWIAESQNEFFAGNYVLGFIQTTPHHPFVLMTDVFELKDFIKSMGCSKGFLFTTGYFTRDIHQPLEGAQVTLYNRRKVLNSLKGLAG